MRRHVTPNPDSERPTVPAWAVAIIRELEAQLDRLYTGRACRACSGSGTETRSGPAGEYLRACGACGGSGLVDVRRD